MKTDKIPINDFRDDDLVPITTAAIFLGMSRSFLKVAKNKGMIPFYKIGGTVRFKVADLKTFLENCRVENDGKEVDNV